MPAREVAESKLKADAEAAAAKHKAELEEAQRTARDLRGEVDQAKLNKAMAAQELKGIPLPLF